MIDIIKSSSFHIFSVLIIFIFITKLCFDKIYITSQIIIDEEFHLVLGEAYCKYDFTEWHPKITTFPGLYLLSSALFGIFGLCSTYWLRFTSLLCSFINLYLFYILFKKNSNVHWKSIWSAVNLALLPPLYFFGHLYYTDVPALTILLLMFLAYEKDNHYLASLFGMVSVLFRQTNIIWVFFIFGSYALKHVLALQKKQKKLNKISVTFDDLMKFLKSIKNQYLLILKRTNLTFWLNIFSYLSIFIAFMIFILINGSIVVGDKSAHVATIHLPQIFYFSLFTLFFGWPHFVSCVKNFFKFVINKPLFTILLIIISLLIVHYNTIVHPYLLADNRHYTFYIWNRFYGYYTSLRYLVVPVYLFALYSIVTLMYHPNDVTFLIFMAICTSIVLIPQKLFEIRYYLVPYVFIRLKMRNVSTISLITESLTYVLINGLTLYIFFTKDIQWPDYNYPQKLIW